MRLLIVVTLFFTPASFAGVPCYQLIKTAGALATRNSLVPAMTSTFSQVAERALRELAPWVAVPEVGAPTIEALTPFPEEQHLDLVALKDIENDIEAARRTAFEALLLIRAAGPPSESGVLAKGILGRFRLGRPGTYPQPTLPPHYAATPILVQDKESILRFLDEMTNQMGMTVSHSNRWWTTTVVGGVMFWPFAAVRLGHAAAKRWAYTNIEFEKFVRSVSASLAVAPPAGAPLNFLVGVRNAGVSYELLFHWAQGSAPVLLGSYAEAPLPHSEEP